MGKAVSVRKYRFQELSNSESDFLIPSPSYASDKIKTLYGRVWDIVPGPIAVEGHKCNDKMIHGLQIKVEEYCILNMTFLKV
jgi:hypothetical protein